MMSIQEPFRKEIGAYKTKGGYGRFVLLGSNYLAGTGLLGYLGHLLDNKTGHDHLYMVSGAILGIVWATYEAFKIAFHLAKETEAEKRQKGKDDQMGPGGVRPGDA